MRKTFQPSAQSAGASHQGLLRVARMRRSLDAIEQALSSGVQMPAWAETHLLQAVALLDLASGFAVLALKKGKKG